MGTEGKEKILSFLDALSDALGESEGVSKEDIIADLKDEGIDVDVALKRIQTMVERASQKARRQQLEIAREKRLALEAEKPTRLANFLDWTKEQILEKISELIPSSGRLGSVSYRELESKSLGDLVALLEDLIAAKEMEEQENPNET
jgi:hypothetical protein